MAVWIWLLTSALQTSKLLFWKINNHKKVLTIVEWIITPSPTQLVCRVVRNYVPVPCPVGCSLVASKLCTRTLETRYPHTLETMHPVPLARNHVPRTLETKHFDQKFDVNVE